MDYSDINLMRTTGQPWIKLTASILLLCVFLTHTAALSPCFTFEKSLDKQISNITLVYNSGKPLEVLCSLQYNYKKAAQELFRGHAGPKPDPSTRIAFFNFTERIDPRYVTRSDEYSAKLLIRNPPLYIGKIYCVMLMDDYERSLAYKVPFSASTINPWYMPQIYPGLGTFICVTDVFVISLENNDLKINVVGTSNTTIDIKLKLPRVVYSDPYFVVNYNMQNETQSMDSITLANRHTVIHKTMFQLENLEINKTYYISVKLCNILNMKEYCTNFTTPTAVRTGSVNKMMTTVDLKTTMNPMTTMNSKTTSTIIQYVNKYKNIQYDPNAYVFYG